VSTDLEILQTLVVPPESPQTGEGDWKSVEDFLGISFPRDYKKFISFYGQGTLQSFMHIWSYLGKHDAKDVIENVTAEYKYDLEKGYEIEFKPYPEPGCLIPFASTNDGNYLNWRTDGEPDSWCVVAYDCDTASLVPAEGVSMVKCIRMLIEKDDPFDDGFCNIENFNPPFSFKC